MVSEFQKRALSRAHAYKEDPQLLFQHLFRFMRERDSDEALSTDWLSLWLGAKKELKSLVPQRVYTELQETFETLKPIDNDIFNIRLKQEDNVVVLLGAGASTPHPSSIPTVASLLPELLRRARKIGREDMDRLADWCYSHSIGNIEDLLTAAYLANYAAKNESVTGLLDYFLFGRADGGDDSRHGVSPANTASSIALLQDTLQTLFGLLTSTMIPAPPNAGHEAVVRFVKQHANTSIVTTNYDGCIDEALGNAGLHFKTHVHGSAEATGLDLIKMHGSINWSYCDSCQELREFDLTAIKKAYANDTFSYAVIGVCKSCGGQRRPLLVPPMAFKFIMFPHLISLWNLAREKIESADYILVVGHSLSEADAYISKIVTRSLAAGTKQKMVVCDPNALLVPTLRSRLSAHIDDFEEGRILQAVGSADELLPRILESLVAGDQGTASPQEPENPAKAESVAHPRGKPRPTARSESRGA